MRRAAADQDHRAGGSSQCSNSLFKQCRVGRRRGPTVGQALIARSRQREDVDRHADVHRAWALRIEDLKCLSKRVGQIGWVAHIDRECADRLHKGGLVGQIVQRSVPLLGILGGSTRGENQHRQRIVVRRGDRGRGVRQPRASDQTADARLARHARVAKRHVARTLLVARCDVPNRRVGQATVVLQRVHARDPEDRVYVVLLEQSNRCLATCRHRSLRRYTKP